MDATKLAEIDEWATDHVPRCYGCDGIARVIVPGTSRPMCAACAPNVPGAVLPLVSVYATTLDLVAEVRRLTAALNAVTMERDRLQRACDEGLPREYIECPKCGKQHLEWFRHDAPGIDGRKRPHHTHRCYHCEHVWDSGRWSFGADVPKPAPESAALDAARREGADEARRIPLKIYLVDGNVIAARSVREAATIADDQCGDSGPVVGPLKGDRTVPMHTTTGEAVQIEVAKLLASGVQRGVVTRALPLDAPGGGS